MDGAFAIRAHALRQIRFMTAGSVDDGKSTLIGRLLLDAGALMRDQSAGVLDEAEGLASLTDGLEAERAQGITIDVAYRYFQTPRASFIIADAPGHEQYTRNMVTAASASDLAVVVIDASRVANGMLKPQTRRHTAIASLMGLDVIVAVNKMDLVDWSRTRFDDIKCAFADLAGALNLGRGLCVPISARHGDNVVHRGAPSPWWAGPTLIEAIEQIRPPSARETGPLRLPVQTVLRDGIGRLYAGRIESGVVRAGDRVAIGPEGVTATIADVRIGGRPVSVAKAGASVAIGLSEERDVARGDIIAAREAPYTRAIGGDLCWLSEAPAKPGKRYLIRQGTLESQALIEDIEFVHDIADLKRREGAETLALNDIARVRIATRDRVLGDLYAELPGTGAFALFDPQTNQTCAAGMIRSIGS
jgi:sulfate adenylyltransferase subunit 1